MPRISHRHADTLTTLLLILSLVLFLLLSANATAQAWLLQQPTQQSSVSGSTAQTAQEIRQLEPGKSVERELAGGESHRYRITLQTGQFLHAEVEQRGINVAVSLTGPGGEKLSVVDLQSGTLGIEPVWWEAEKAGEYRLEVRAVSVTAEGGKYALKSEVRAAATAQDRDRMAAGKLLSEAVQQEREGTAESQRRAIEDRKQALLLWRKVSDRYWEAYTLTAIGGAIFNSLHEQQKALEYFNQVLPIWRAIEDRSGEARTLINMGIVYDSMGEPQKALDYFNQALPIWRAIEDRSGEARTLTNMGLVYIRMGVHQKALIFLNQALPLHRAIGDRRGEANALGIIGTIYQETNQPQKALEFLNRASSLQRATGDRRGEGSTLTIIGHVYFQLGENQKALDYYNQALAIWKVIGNRQGEANALVNIANVYVGLSEEQKAMEYYNQVLSITRVIGRRYEEAIALIGIGNVYDYLSEKQKALEYYNQGLPITRAISDRSHEANTLTNIGIVYHDLGEEEKALEYLNQALPIIRAVEDHSYEALTLIYIGNVYASLGDQPESLKYYNQALPITRAIGDRRNESEALLYIGQVYADMGEQQKALESFNQALPITRAIGDRADEVLILTGMGIVYAGLGNHHKALEYFNQSQPISKAIGDRSGEAETLYNLARLERDQNNLLEARRDIEAALSIIESLRSAYTNQELRSAYFATVQDYYEFYIDLLMRLHKLHPADGFDARALQTSERARARTLLETLAEAGANIRQGIDPKLVERERSLQQRLNAKGKNKIDLLNGPHTAEQVASLDQEIEALTAEFQQTEAEIRQTSPHYAALTQPQPLTLKEIKQQVLDSDTLLLEYSLGKDRSYLWAVTPTSMTSYELPKREEIERAARQVYALFSRTQLPTGEIASQQQRGLGLAQATEKRGLTLDQSTDSAEGAAQRLSRMVLSPVAAQLGRKRLLIIADGTLQFIPFSALPNPLPAPSREAAPPLIVDHEVISLPSASTLAVLRRDVQGRAPAAKALAVLADPVFARDDERLTRTTAKAIKVASASPVSADESRGLGLVIEQVNTAASETGVTHDGLVIPRLPFTRREAAQIAALVPEKNRMEVLDFAASRATMMSPQLSQYRYVHIATHGFLDSQHPELSGLVLSMVDEQGQPQDGFLRAHEVFNLKLPAELVVLSACQTGLGKEVKGEGLVGLTRGFMYAGSPRVVVSLWSVNDEATAELMTRFYRGMLKEGLRPTKALQAAQVSMLAEKRYSAPFYWAAFTLQGEWR